MNIEEQIEKTKKFIKNRLAGETTGHDWWHTYRVWKIAQKISEKEGGDSIIIELGALLHDVADFKFHGGDESVGPKIAREWLEKIKIEDDKADKIIHIVENISFKGAGVKNKMLSLEGKIVQDADRMEALGAIGIARCFAYGGKSNREIYNPEIPPKLHKDAQSYKNNNSTSLNHFYEKLLLLKDKMNTKTGREMAEGRHRIIENFLNEFMAEWEGKK